MSEEEYEEQNLDEFFKNASSILCEDSNPEKENVIEALKDHLSPIFHDKNEMQNIFILLNSVIFPPDLNQENSKHQKIYNKQPFKLYPLIFSFNPKSSYYYIDYFLSSLEKSVCQENRENFTFLSIIFAEVIEAFFSDEKKNKNLMKKYMLLSEQSKKIKLYEKIINFCNGYIKTNLKIEQSFGCLLLTEFIEKCPLVKEEKYLDSIFKTIADYLDDRFFECKLDLLNCTLSLILAAEAKFKPYADICLFRVLDYLTDSEWMKRKLAINVVYTLVFYCKEEILAVKENIIDFLNILKDDSVPEVRDVCLQTMAFIQENEAEMNENKKNKIISSEEKNKPNMFNKPKQKNKNESNTKNKPEPINKNLNKKKIKSASTDQITLAQKLKKEGEYLEILEKGNNNINNSNNSKKGNDSNMNSYQFTINGILDQLKRIQDDQNQFINIVNNLKQTVDNNFTSLNERINNLEKIAGINTNDINNDKENNGIVNLESYEKLEDESDIKSYKGSEKNKNKKMPVLSKKEEQNQIEELKKKFSNGKYNEALIEAKDNDKYLIKLLPLIDKNNIIKIDQSLLEEIIVRLNKRLSIICVGKGRGDIKDILLFYILLTKSKINLQLITLLSIKDTLKFLKTKSNNKLIQSDINNIELILKSLKV